uniref:ribosomal protein S4 n=1 Tax=Carex alatauensis TaxID=544729 RepID=UPI001F13894A|nr:ribosomal protein S4 [Carex alatauensis]UKU08198.1 ribosomal protein S4 [Carex alatauensis]
MSRYRGPRLKKIRRLRALPGLVTQLKYNKNKKKQKHIPFRKRNKEYRVRLEEKQKLRFNYGLTERQLVRYMHIAGKSKGSTGQVLLQLLEMRLDNIVFRLNMASTIPGARQLVNHRHILVNGHIVDIPSYRCKPRDIITTKNNERFFEKTKILKPEMSKHLSISKDYKARNFQGQVKKIIDRSGVLLSIKEFLVVEYYSRQI